MNAFIAEDDHYTRIELPERTYERALARIIRRALPGWQMYRWDPLVEGPEGRGKPDQILIRDDLEDWFVVEVELASHPESHFRNQFRVLGSAAYSTYLTDSIRSSVPNLAPEDVASLLRRPPGFLCIADADSESLRMACRDYGFEFLVLRPYRSNLGKVGMLSSAVPRPLREHAQGLAVYALTYSTRIGGHLFFDVPRDFPRLQTFVLRTSNTECDCDIKQRASGRRVALIPSDLVDVRHALWIRWIDPDGTLFELDRSF